MMQNVFKEKKLKGNLTSDGNNYGIPQLKDPTATAQHTILNK